MTYLRLVFAFTLLVSTHAWAQDFTYAAIAERHEATRLAAADVKQAQMQGECLVGLKRLIFVKRENFSPVAEWINYRTLSLLEQFPPCEVLIMMQVARAELIRETSP